MRRRYPCLGCHTLNGEGGRIGPDLSTVGTRRSPAFIYAMLAAPQRTVPGTVMPQVPMPDGTRQLIANYLWQRGAGGREQPVREPSRLPAQPASSLPGAPSSESGATDSAALYAKYCASCHGASGRGDGPNARYLPVAPTAHSSAAYMAQRPDDSLFDAIAAGGYVMNRSHLMPPFGASLTPAQIWSLVGYLRQLCRCVGPPWSRDNQ